MINYINNKYFCLMFSLKKISSLALSLQTRPVYLFSKDGWKDRDEASEKVYISQAESKF